SPVGRRQHQLSRPAVACLSDYRPTAEADLFHAGLAVDHQGMLDPETCGHLRHERHQVRTENAEEMALRSRRVRQGSEDVEYGAHAELPTRPYRVLNGGMELRGDTEAWTRRLQN